MTKRVLFALVLAVLVFLPVAASAAGPSFAQLQTRAAAVRTDNTPALRPMALTGVMTKSEIPRTPPYANFYVSFNPDTEAASLRMFVSNVSFSPAGPMGVRLNGELYGTLPQHNGLQTRDNSGQLDYTLEALLKPNLPFGATRARLTIPFSGDAYYNFVGTVSVPQGDFFDACLSLDAFGDVTGVDVFTRIRGYAAGSSLPQAAYTIASDGFTATAMAYYDGGLPSPVWLYVHMDVSDYFSHFAGGFGGSHSLSLQIEALGNSWISFDSWYPSNPIICQKG